MGLNPLDAPVDVTIACWEWGTYLGEEGMRNGVRAKVSSWRRISPDSLIPHAKAIGQYLNSVLAKVESVKAGYEEAILLDDHGHVCEGTGENVYIVRDGVISTPGQHNSILDGITRRSVMQIAQDLGYEVVERNVARAEMYLADEVFLSGTAAEIVPVREVDDHKVGTGKPGEITRVLQAAFDDAIHGRSERYREWLDVVTPGRSRRRPPARRRRRSRPPRARRRMADIQLYDATLRDGMGGGGLTLTAEEKLRVVHALDELGVRHDRGRLPGVQPEGAGAVRAARARVAAARGDRRVRDDPPPRRRAPSRTRACACSRSASRRSCTLVGKASLLHVEKVVRVSREENLAMIGDSVALPRRRSGKRVLLDAEHFFDGFALDPALCARLPARGCRGRRRAARAVRHQRRLTASSCEDGVGGGAAKRCPARALGIHTHDDSGCAVANTLDGRRIRRHAGAGHGQRHRRAHRQRQPDHDHRRPAAEDGRASCWRPSASRG